MELQVIVTDKNMDIVCHTIMMLLEKYTSSCEFSLIYDDPELVSTCDPAHRDLLQSTMEIVDIDFPDKHHIHGNISSGAMTVISGKTDIAMNVKFSSDGENYYKILPRI